MGKSIPLSLFLTPYLPSCLVLFPLTFPPIPQSTTSNIIHHLKFYTNSPPHFHIFANTVTASTPQRSNGTVSPLQAAANPEIVSVVGANV